MPVGTGPFKVVEYVKDDRLVMEAYEDYWDGPPRLARVTYRFIREDATRLADFQTGAIDIMQNVPVSQAQVVQSDSKLTLLPVDSPTVTQLRIDTTLPPTDNVNVRKAINYAIDVDTIIETVLGGYGRRVSSFQSAMSFGHDPNLEPYPYDPEMAKSLLAEANFQAGTELTITFSSTDSTFKEVVQAAASYLTDVGFKPALNPVEAQTLFSDLIPNGKAGNLWQFGWGGWTLDFDNTAYLLYHEGEYWNPTFADPRAEELLTQERTTLELDIREQAFHELARLLTKELVVEVDLYQVVNLWATNERVQNFTPPPDDRVNLHKVWVTS
jgi:peptide/nickel transport system substrate-binding protein